MMSAFLAAMQRASEAIRVDTEIIRRELVRVDVSTSALAPFREIEDWVGQQIPRLRARAELIRKDPAAWRPSGGLLGYDENAVPFTSPQESMREGAALAARFRDLAKAAEGRVGSTGHVLVPENPTVPRDGQISPRLRELVASLLAHKDDAEFTAAFFANLGTAGTLELPRDIARWWNGGRPVAPDAEDGTGTSLNEALRGVSVALGTAVTASSRVPGAARVMEDLRRRVHWEKDREALSWLVSSGEFPADWLADAVRANVIIPMLQDSVPWEDRLRGTTARFLEALAADPVAVRLAITAGIRDPASREYRLWQLPLNAVLEALAASAARDDHINDAFAHVLAAGSGVYDEKDGQHSRDAAAFAFQVIMSARSFGLTDVMRTRLSEIGGAYTTEIAASADQLDPDSDKPSTFGAFDDNLPGTEPQFRLSLPDAYRFVQLFADTDEHMQPFDTGMADLSRRLFTQGVRIDRERIAHPPADGSQPEMAVELVFRRLGKVAGLEFAAAKVVQGTADLREKKTVEAIAVGLDKGVDLLMIGAPGAGVPAKLGWTVLSWGVKDGIGLAIEPEPRLPRVREKELSLTRAALYDIACGLIRDGYTTPGAPVRFTAPTGRGITDESGRLLPFSVIENDPAKRKAFLHWLRENGSLDEDADRRTFGKLVVQVADAFAGAQVRMEGSLAQKDPKLNKILTGAD